MRVAEEAAPARRRRMTTTTTRTVYRRASRLMTRRVVVVVVATTTTVAPHEQNQMPTHRLAAVSPSFPLTTTPSSSCTRTGRAGIRTPSTRPGNPPRSTRTTLRGGESSTSSSRALVEVGGCDRLFPLKFVQCCFECPSKRRLLSSQLFSMKAKLSPPK